MRSVPELKIRNANVIDVSTFYRSTGLCTKELKKIIRKMRSFPAHHEARFAQHLIQLCQAVLHNLEGCHLHWQKVIDAPSAEYEKSEKRKAHDFIKLWQPSSLQTWLTAFMVDICSIFRYIENESQKDKIIIPEILRYRNVALEKLELLVETPYPGKNASIFMNPVLGYVSIYVLHFSFPAN